MIALVGLGLRLGRAGGRLRGTAIVGSNALGAFLLLLLASFPDARLGDDPGAWAVVEVVQVAGVLAIPVVILLLTVGRLGSATRDRRLAALRVLGLPPDRARLVAVAESAPFALVGAVVGVGVFALGAPLTDARVATEGVVGDSGDWFVEPLRASGLVALGVVVILVLVAGATAVASTWRLASDPLAARSWSTRRAPLPWSLAPLVGGAGLLGWYAAVPAGVDRAEDVSASAALVVGVLLLAVAVAFVPPLLTSWLAGVLVRSRWTSARLAGRGVQTEPASAARLVAGVGVATFAAIGALGYLGALHASPNYRLERLAATTGPQVAFVLGDHDHMITRADLELIGALPDVLAVAPGVSVRECGADGPCPQVFVGTCEGLARIMVVTGCSDSAAAIIRGREVPGTPPGASLLYEVRDEPLGDARQLSLAVTGAPIDADAEATAARWGGAVPNRGSTDGPVPFGVFVPMAMVAPGPEDVVGMSIAEVFVAGGPDAVARVADALAARDLLVDTPTSDTNAREVRGAAWLVAAFVAVWFVLGLLGLLLSAIDRARERRRAVGRLVAVGVPPRVLLAAQAWQVGVPLAVALAVAGLAGTLLVRAVRVAERAPFVDLDATMPATVAVVVLVAVIVPLLTLPAANVRLTPELLREE